MRTTLKIDDDILHAARALAENQGKTIGEVISALARKGLKPETPAANERGFPVFEVREDAPAITPDMVYRARDDGE